MISDEKKIQNCAIFFKKLKEVGVDTSIMEDSLQDALREAPYKPTKTPIKDLSYNGALLNVVLRTLTPIALGINKLLPEGDQVSQESIIKVCLLHQLSKATMFEPNPNQWEIDNRGILFKYAPYKYALKMGMRSILMCNEFNVQLSPEEIEAISLIDRDPGEEQVQFRANSLSVILRQAMELTNLINR